MNSRRTFLAQSSLGLLAAVTALRGQSQQKSTEPAPGTPPAFGTAPAVGPEVSPSTFAEAEKLVQVEMSQGERTMAADSWRSTMAALYERRTGPRKVTLETAPASLWDPVLPGQPTQPKADRFIRSSTHSTALPATDEDIAFAPYRSSRAGSKRES